MSDPKPGGEPQSGYFWDLVSHATDAMADCPGVVFSFAVIIGFDPTSGAVNPRLELSARSALDVALEGTELEEKLWKLAERLDQTMRDTIQDTLSDGRHTVVRDRANPPPSAVPKVKA